MLNVAPFETFSLAEKLKIISDGRPTPDLNITKVIEIKKKRSYTRKFNPDIYVKYLWMAGSVKLNCIFCWPCVLFSRKINVWNFTGYNDLCHYISASISHEQKQGHYKAVLELSTFGSYRVETSSNENLRNNEKVEQSRRVFRRLIDISCFLAKQEIPFLGHNESAKHDDHFTECLNLISRYDGLLGNHLQSDHKSVFKGVSDDRLKNDIIGAISCVIINKIKCEVNSSEFVALIVEETSTSRGSASGSAQLCFILRYLTTTRIVERFLGFVDVIADRTAEYITEVIINKLKDFHCCSKLIAQEYDGAASSDVQSRLKLQCPHAMLAWCSLNSVLSKSCERIPAVRSFFHVVKSMGNFFEASTKRTEFYNRLCDRTPRVAVTRWDCNSETINTISSERHNLIELFENITDLPDDWDGETINLSKSYLFSLRDFEFIFFIHIYEQIFKLIDKVLNIVQKGVKHVESCIREIKQFEYFMKDLSFDSNYASAIALTREPKNKINISDIKLHYQCIFQEIKNNILKEFNERYKSIEEQSFLELLDYGFYRKFNENFPLLQFSNLKSHFPLFFDFERLENELIYVYGSKDFAKKNLIGILNFCALKNINSAFPQLIKLASLLLTIPNGSKPVDDSFSALKRIHTYLRSTQKQKGISDLSIITIEKELLLNLMNSRTFYDDVISEFSKRDKRIPLTHALGILHM